MTNLYQARFGMRRDEGQFTMHADSLQEAIQLALECGADLDWSHLPRRETVTLIYAVVTRDGPLKHGECPNCKPPHKV